MDALARPLSSLVGFLLTFCPNTKSKCPPRHEWHVIVRGGVIKMRQNVGAASCRPCSNQKMITAGGYGIRPYKDEGTADGQRPPLRRRGNVPVTSCRAHRPRRAV